MNAGLALSDVARAYRGRAAVNGVSFAAPPGEVLAVLGASGSGKSTLLRLIAGLEPLDAGTIALGGAVASRVGYTLAPERRRVGLVFQDYALFPHLRALDNVMFGLAKRQADQRRANALVWLERVGLAGKAQAYPHELSGGEQQRVALARALAPEPDVVLMDEPFSGLDPLLRHALRDLTRETARGARGAFVFVTHDAAEALHMGDRIAVMAGGALVQVDTPQALYAMPKCLAAMAALGPVNTFAGVVRGEIVETPFGPLSAHGLSEGINAIAAVRVEGLRLSPGGKLAQVDRRPQGAHDLVSVRGSDQGTVWRGLVTAGVSSAERWTAALDPAAAFVFPV
jgi:iron(III) transport system ATP-binding protein